MVNPMTESIRTLVIFKSSLFNSMVVKDYFINPCCFGDDAAKWMMKKLHENGIHTAEEPVQEDFGWFFEFRVGSDDYHFTIGYRPGDGDEGEWIGWIERNPGFFGTITGGRHRNIRPEAIQAIASILSNSPEIREVHWHYHKDFDRGREDLGTKAPFNS